MYIHPDEIRGWIVLLEKQIEDNLGAIEYRRSIGDTEKLRRLRFELVQEQELLAVLKKREKSWRGGLRGLGRGRWHRIAHPMAFELALGVGGFLAVWAITTASCVIFPLPVESSLLYKPIAEEINILKRLPLILAIVLWVPFWALALFLGRRKRRWLNDDDCLEYWECLELSRLLRR